MKWILRLLGVVLAVLIVLVGAVFFVPAERLAGIATEQIARATGREVAIRGDVSFTFWPTLGFSADDLEVGNADWAAQGPMFQAANAAIGVDAMSLLRGDIRITNIAARSPMIRLEKKLDGRASWQFSDSVDTAQKTGETPPAPAPTTKPAAATRSFSIARLEVTDATLVYDAEGSDLVSLAGVDLTLDWPDPDGAAEVVAVLRPADQPVTVDLAVDRFGAFVAGEVSPLRANLRTQSGEVRLDGRAGTNGAAEGNVTLETGDTDGFLAALGLPPAGLPPKLGQRVSAKTAMTLTPDRQLALRGLRLDLGGNVLTGDADLSLNGIPRINARLDAGALDLSGAGQGGGASAPASGDASATTGSGGSGAAPKAAAGGWSRAPIDASALGSFEGDIALDAESIDLGTFQLGRTRTVLRNAASRMVFDLREVAAYGGSVTGEFVLNNRGALSVGGKLSATGLDMQPLLADAAQIDRLTGKGALNLAFLGTGQSVDAIMRSLSGDGALEIGQGTILGVDLDALFRGEVPAGNTDFGNLNATWTMALGVLSNRDLLLGLRNYSVSGEGTVGLGARRVDYRLVPKALRANSGKGLEVPVIVEGPWSDISVRPDVEAVLEQRLDKEKDRLEKRAKEKLSRELGVDPDAGKSVEDEIKDRLLRKLFE